MSERTVLTANEERQFRQWAAQNGIRDVDHQMSRYDYRGYWKATQGAAHTQGEHFPDTFKQHGHPTFSEESQYSRGPFDGGTWQGETFNPSGADLLMNSRGQQRGGDIAQALQVLAQTLGRPR